MIQGEFSLKELNLLLVYQVNCPGCFLYALPIFNQLFNDRDLHQLSFLALSTSFEDFDMNTRENTELLVNNGILVGETKLELQKHGHDTLPYQINFPIAMDSEIKDTSSILSLALDICGLNPNYKTWAEWEQKIMKNKVENYLNQLEKISYTFTSNQLKGTPTIIAFDNQFRILAEWFGYTPFEILKDRILNLTALNKDY